MFALWWNYQYNRDYEVRDGTPVGEREEQARRALELQQQARAARAGWVDPRSRTVAEAAACGELGLVGSSASVGDSGYVGCGDCGCGKPVCVGSLDVESVRVGELLDLMVDLGEARARLEGMLMTVAGEVARRNGWEATAWMMREYNRVPSMQARAEAGLAHTLVAEGRTETLTALCEGEITLSHARVVARAAYKDHARSEADLLELGRVYPSDVVARHMVIHDRPTDSAEELRRRGRPSTAPVPWRRNCAPSARSGGRACSRARTACGT